METAATITNPPIVYATQANVTTGPQQVNNGMPLSSPARESVLEQTQLLETEDGKWMDTRVAGAAGGGDTALAALEEEHWAKVPRG